MSFIWSNPGATSGSAIGNMFTVAGGEFDFTMGGSINATLRAPTKSFLIAGSNASSQAVITLGNQTDGPDAAYAINPATQ